jgi:hypothetical protein
MEVMQHLLDLRTPISLTDDECALIGQIVSQAVTEAVAQVTLPTPP